MFPAVPAWGQASSQGRRNVTAPRAPDTEDEPDADEAGEEEISNRPKRMRRPSSRYNGLEWVAQKRVVPNAAT
jgi:hypothetical protein